MSGGTVGRSRTRAATATFVANALNAAIVGVQAIVLVPLYLHGIGPRLYGAWLASAEVLVWMQAVDLGIPNLMIQRIATAHARGDRSAAADWFAAGIVVLAFVAALIAAVGAAISVVLPGWVGAAPDQSHTLGQAFLVGTIATSATLFANGFVGLARAIQDTYFLSAALIVSAFAGLVTSLAFIVAGWGLWAIPFGLVARAAVGLAAALVFATYVWYREFRVPFRIERRIITELLTSSPATALGGFSYTLMTQSEILLVAVLIRPQLAVVYALTRRAADLGRSFADIVGFASYGGLAHLVSSLDHAGARKTYNRIVALHLACALAVAAAYLAVTKSLLDVWVGSAVAGSLVLIFAMSIQSIVLGHSYLINLLYRATGHVVDGSLFLVAEALVRVPLLATMLLAFGLPGLPLAATATATVSAVLVRRRTISELQGHPTQLSQTAIWIARVLIAAVASTLAIFVFVPRWSYVLLMGGAMAVVALLALVFVDPRLRPLVRSTARQLLPAVPVRS